jgi:hypothetical protein
MDSPLTPNRSAPPLRQSFGAQSGRNQHAVQVRFWHIADVPLALTNVCFEGKNGHNANGPSCLLMTLSGSSYFPVLDIRGGTALYLAMGIAISPRGAKPKHRVPLL